jgi:hypothetical protein
MEKTATKQKRSISKGAIDIITGIYELIGNKFNIKGKTINILTRKKTTKGKPTKYIHSIAENVYISSLYPLEDNHYNFDYKNRQYILTLEPERVIIKLLE